MMNPKNKKTAKQYLKKDPFLLFNEFNHKYYDLKRKCIFSKSISDIKNYNKKNDYTDENIEKGKLRGTVIHKACEIYCKTKNKPAALSHAGEYKNSVFNFINSNFWNTWDVVVSEFQLADRITDVAGTLDLSPFKAFIPSYAPVVPIIPLAKDFAFSLFVVLVCLIAFLVFC